VRQATADLSPSDAGIERAEAEPELEGDLDLWPVANQLIGGILEVQGWVMSRPPAAIEVSVLVNGRAWPAWVRFLSGVDMPPPSSSSPLIPRFHVTLDTRSIPDGRHVLAFVARCGGRTLILGQRSVAIRNRELLGVADGLAGELVERLVRERETLRVELQERLDTLARERDAQRLELEGRCDALARERDAQRLELEGRCDALTRERDAQRLELEQRLDALTQERDAERLELEERLDALAHALNLEIERIVRERDEATAHLRRMLDTWPVRLYGRAVRLPGAATLMRRIVGVRR
jgi:hypothetical protein